MLSLATRTINQVKLMQEKGLAVDADPPPARVQVVDADMVAAAAPWKGISWVPSKRAYRVRYGTAFAGYCQELDAAISLAMGKYGWTRKQMWLGPGDFPENSNAGNGHSLSGLADPGRVAQVCGSGGLGDTETDEGASARSTAVPSSCRSSPPSSPMSCESPSVRASPAPAALAPAAPAPAAVAADSGAACTPPRRKGGCPPVPASWQVAPPDAAQGGEPLPQRLQRFNDLCRVYGDLCPGDLADFIDRRRRAAPNAKPNQPNAGLGVRGWAPPQGNNSYKHLSFVYPRRV